MRASLTLVAAFLVLPVAFCVFIAGRVSGRWLAGLAS